MKLLILTAFYPIPDGTHERMFVHVRNKYYSECKIDVTVLNFDCKHDYSIDGISVISLKTYIDNNCTYDLAICHSANVRNHYRFLKKYENRFNHIVFFFHGHEVLYLNKDYPQPYKYMKSHNLYRKVVQGLYDYFKLSVWKRYYKKLSHKSEYIFVSNWIFEYAMKNLGVTIADWKNHYHIINNSIGVFFETADYNSSVEKTYDFITIRGNLDGSKYGIDLVARIAEINPQAKFLVIGKGKYFNYNKKPDNVTWIDRTLNHEEMKKYLDKSRCALMLTREDTQGVMTCELAAYGIPVITSDIDVCHEMFNDIPNIAMISNEGNEDILKIRGKLEKGLPYMKNRQYFADRTIAREVALYKKLCE